ncbi:hypothetical protein PY310_06065 [Pseudarthrobacter sp. H3Y2-7]|uniref:hypothetical protein n=1 Tax=Pseudarthrobacter naphthalenicus TaxID=3031328 RepID=UPI0023B088C0|nr:hypothetical protein [Pseudarthrobacter sp. H3Y2-7]MDE8668149.1 hypothetical protein [Pseudarthrobacter sp. H3Y2-7]
MRNDNPISQVGVSHNLRKIDQDVCSSKMKAANVDELLLQVCPIMITVIYKRIFAELYTVANSSAIDAQTVAIIDCHRGPNRQTQRAPNKDTTQQTR